MNRLAALFFIVFFYSSTFGQSKNIDHALIIKEQAEEMVQWLLKKDFRSFCKYTYPKIIEMMGGQQKMVEFLEKSSKEMKSEGVEFLNITIGNPSDVIIVGNELQCTVPQTLEVKVPNGRVISQSTLIAISKDNGKQWYFVDTSGKDIQTMKKTLPNLSAELIIPEKSQPKFYPE